jgi:hypothetical protein
MKNKVFYFKHFIPHLKSVAPVLDKVMNNTTDAGRFYINLSRVSGYESYIPRSGVWDDPFAVTVEPQFIMPAYNPNFGLTFSEVTDSRANDLKQLINNTNRPINIFYSGGIDSTVIIVSLIKNLSANELKRITISTSSDAIIENPNFFKNFIQNKFTISDSTLNLFSDYSNRDNAYCITADLGDCMFGTELGTKMYSHFRSLSNSLPNKIEKDITELYYNVSSAQKNYTHYKDLIIHYFNTNLNNAVKNLQKNQQLSKSIGQLTDIDLSFGETYYEKIVRNIQTSTVPIHSLHDFFWWTIFNLKYMNCSLRASVLYSTGSNRKKLVTDSIFHWYGSTEYQLWSMANNNNGEKINGTTQSSYKWAARNYIYEVDKNEWYFNHKIKIPSLPFITKRNYRKYYTEFDTVFGMDSNYDIISFNNPTVDNFIIESLTKFNFS